MRKVLHMNLVPRRFKLRNRAVAFESSSYYWINRYAIGGNSGGGSYGILARYKADVLNKFVKQHRIDSVIEFGCGDGNNLSLFNFPSYLGVDISDLIILQNKKKFIGNNHWAFMSLESSTAFSYKADLTLSLDVIYHLVEDEVFEFYMSSLFKSSTKFVIIYSSNVDFDHPAAHVRHRKFSNWIDAHRPEFELFAMMDNPHKSELLGDDHEKSFADFHIYRNTSQ